MVAMSAEHEALRVLYAREHTTIYPGLGVFLAGPTPPDGQMTTGWRRRVIARLVADPRLDPRMVVVAPEPGSGRWSDIDLETGRPRLDAALNKQIPWESQYLRLCDITVFWLPTYWDEGRAGAFPANIGPTTRWEFGYYLQEYLKRPRRRAFIVGAPEDAESLTWARLACAENHIRWHSLARAEKAALVPDSLVEAIADTLLANARSRDAS